MFNLTTIFRDAQDIEECNERARLVSEFVGFAGSIYALPLFMFFSIADYIWYNEFFYKFLVIRLVSILCIYVLSRISKKFKSFFDVQVKASLFIIACVLPLHIMMIYIKDSGSPYYAGLLLTFVGLSNGFRFSWKFYFLNAGIIIFPYVIIGLFKNGTSINSFFFLNIMFFVSVVLISFIGRIFLEKIYFQEILNRKLLRNEINNRDEIISIKTKESLKLASLKAV